MKLVRVPVMTTGIAVIACVSAWAQTTTLVSVDSNGAPGNGRTFAPAITPDGRWVAFYSVATNLVPGDTNGAFDVFVHDVQSGETTRMSVSSTGAQGDGDSAFAPSITPDGRYVAFQSKATNLVPVDTNGVDDIFVHDRVSGVTTRASVAANGMQGDDDSSFPPAITPDGRWVAFRSEATNLVAGDTNGFADIFVRDLPSGTTTRVSVGPGGVQANGNSSASPSITPDGRYVAFSSFASNLVAGDTNGLSDVFVRDVQSGTTTLVSVASDGAQSNGHCDFSTAVTADSISSTGRYVAFQSEASNLVPGDTNGWTDVFVRDLQSGTTTQASVSSSGMQGNDDSRAATISWDGRFVAFQSVATNLVSADNNGSIDVFVRDLQGGTTKLVSVTSTGAQGNNDSFTASISSDGRYLAFGSNATNLAPGDGNGFVDIFVRDRGAASAFIRFCFGDGTAEACPCGNNGSAGHGCENSADTGGAHLTATGVASLSGDTVQLTSSGELPTTLSVVIQGSAAIAAVPLGDGLRCEGGIRKRLYVKSAVGGVVIAPGAGEPSISTRSAALGDPIPPGATRNYQVYYRDADLTFCPNPPGNSWNASNGIAIAWGS